MCILFTCVNVTPSALKDVTFVGVLLFEETTLWRHVLWVFNTMQCVLLQMFLMTPRRRIR